MRNWVVATAASLAIACGGGAATRPSGARDQTPSWLAEGTGAFRTEGGKRLQGVGVASGVADPKRGAARRTERRGNSSRSRRTRWRRPWLPGRRRRMAPVVAEIARKAGSQAAAIRDHWVTPDGDERALGVIEVDAFKRALQAVEGDDRVKSEMYSNVDRAFDQIAGGAR